MKPKMQIPALGGNLTGIKNVFAKSNLMKKYNYLLFGGNTNKI